MKIDRSHMYDKNAFLLERYKYVLLRKQQLNEATFKITAIYQVLLLALAAGQYNVVTQWKSQAITGQIADTFSKSVMAMVIALSVLIMTLLAGGIFSWLKYRRDESQIELAVHGITRPAVAFKSIFRWYETYLALIVVFVLVCWIYVYTSHLSTLFA